MILEPIASKTRRRLRLKVFFEVILAIFPWSRHRSTPRNLIATLHKIEDFIGNIPDTPLIHKDSALNFNMTICFHDAQNICSNHLTIPFLIFVKSLELQNTKATTE